MDKIFRKLDYGNGVKYWFMFGRPIAKKNGNCFYLLKPIKGDHWDADDWYAGWHSWKFDISYEACGYETANGELNISILGWHSTFRLPWKSKRFPYGDCDAPKWGIAIHDNTFWIYRGGNGNMGGGTKWWTWDIPFWTMIHMRHEVMCNIDGEKKLIPYDSIGKEKDGKYLPMEKNEMVDRYFYDYTDKYDGEVIPCTFWIEEREWRPKWLTWTGRWKYVKKYIEIVFNNEVGSRKGSWKGGCIGCSYDLLENETPMECIKRMERERDFR